MGTVEWEHISPTTLHKVGPCYMLPKGYLCSSCIEANHIGVLEALAEDEQDIRSKSKTEAEQLQRRFESLYRNGGIAWDAQEETPRSMNSRPRLKVGSAVVLRGSDQVHTVRAIIDPYPSPRFKQQVYWSWVQSSTSWYVVMLENDRFVRAHRVRAA